MNDRRTRTRGNVLIFKGMQDGPDIPPPLNAVELELVRGGGLADDPDPIVPHDWAPGRIKAGIIVDDNAPIEPIPPKRLRG